VSGVHQHSPGRPRLTGVKPDACVLARLGGVKFTSPVLPHRSVWSLGGLSRADLLAVLDGAGRLKQAARAGKLPIPLRGKNLALLGDVRDELLARAATELGAKVALLSAADGNGLNGSVRLLGRLYDAVDGGPMAAAALEQLDRDAGVPVYNGLGTDDHPTRVLAELLAMREHADKPLSALKVFFIGDPQTPCGEALRQAADLTGIDLRLSGSPAGADFVIDASNRTHWTLSDGTGPIDDAERADDRRFIVQALLVNTIS
jgi:ornithine carbamoyltransferase